MEQLAATNLFGWMGGYGVRGVSALKAICLSINHYEVRKNIKTIRDR